MSPLRPALAGLALICAGPLLAGCGDETERNTGLDPQLQVAGEIAAGTSATSSGSRTVERLREVAGGGDSTLVVGAAALAGVPAAGSRLSIWIDGSPAQGAQGAPLPGDPSVLVAACACRLDPDGHVFELRLSSKEPVRTRAASLAVSDDLSIEEGAGGGLPAPLIAADVRTRPERIGSGGAALARAELPADLGGRAPIELLGQVRAARPGNGGDLEAIQISAFAGDARRIQPGDDDSSQPGNYTAAYEASAAAGDPVGIAAATPVGSTPVAYAATFACRCRPAGPHGAGS